MNINIILFFKDSYRSDRTNNSNMDLLAINLFAKKDTCP